MEMQNETNTQVPTMTPSETSTPVASSPVVPSYTAGPTINTTIDSHKKTPLGPVIGLVVIIAIIVVGSLYFWGQRTEKSMMNVPVDTTSQTNGTQETSTDAQTQQLQTQSSSDSIDSIEADLNATDLGSIDAGVSE